MLCETLLSYLPTGTEVLMLCDMLITYIPTGAEIYQLGKLLKAYSVLPVKSVMSDHNRLDLWHHATTRAGVLYITRPVLERLWVPLGSLPPSSRVTAKTLLDFFGVDDGDHSSKAGNNNQGGRNHSRPM